jgi:hypothetical protein
MGLLDSFCKDFIDRVFIPYLEKKVLDSFQRAVEGVDSFQTAFQADAAPYPLTKVPSPL